MQEQTSPFDTFSRLLAPESRRVLDLAREEMLGLKHWWIGTEHLLWGLTSEGSLTQFLNPLGITPERIHAGILFIFDRHPAVTGQSGSSAPPAVNPTKDPLVMLTPRAKQVIVLAGEEAKSRGDKSIQPTHLLLGLMNEGEGIGAGLLRSLGVSLLQARTVLIPPTANQVCAFCGRSGSQVARLFPAEVGVAESASPQLGPFICDQCVTRFHAMLGTA